MAYAEREPDVRATERLELVDEVGLYRAEWRLDADLIAGLRTLPVTLVEAVGTADHWRFEIRTQERDTVPEFQTLFESAGIHVDLNRMYELAELIDDDRLTLTSNQRETLVAAFRQGYFDQPREVTQAELVGQFEISRRAVSDRLRRGVRNLVGDELLPDGEDHRRQ